jgi:hypothetical protein
MKTNPPLPTLLTKKRTRPSTRPPFITTTLDPPLIRLIPRTPPTSPIPGSLPIPTMGIETQEPDAQDDATSSVSHKVAETQEPTTHSVAETQEPTTHSVAETKEPTTHSVAETQEPTIAETQESTTAETQEPAADIEMELQEPDAQTSFVSNKVAETQEPTTHPVAETQEPTTDFEIELQESEAQNAATLPSSSQVAEKPTTHSVVETQEPTNDTEIDIQELEAQGAATLLFLHQEAETQGAATIPAATPQQPEATMASVLQENEFLKSELEAYKQELATTKEAYEKELNLYTLGHIATLLEKTTESLCKEYMCCQCGDIYYQAGYKVIQVPVPGAAPIPSPFVAKEEPAATQEPAGPPKPKTEPAATQEPIGPPKLKTEPCIATNEAPTFVNKAVQTMPMEEFTPPNQINLPTSREQSTQTLPHPTTSNAETQTQLWDEQAEIQKWKKEYAKNQAKNLQVHKQIWINHTYSNWEALEQTR